MSGVEIVTNIMMIASKIRPDMDEHDLFRIQEVAKRKCDFRERVDGRQEELLQKSSNAAFDNAQIYHVTLYR
jgi:hypothetical protein